MSYHNPVLLNECIDGLNIKPNGVYVDVTFGGGGHAREIIKHLGKDGKLIGFDQDQDAKKNKIDDERFLFINENFQFIERYLKLHGIKKVDGILADLGVSSHQFDVAKRGFSTRFNTSLDMRMNKQGSISAYDIINNYDENKLSNIFYKYGELKNSRGIASEIIAARNEKEIKYSFELKTAIKKYLPPIKENKILAQLFQAIRIEVNQELYVLKEFLKQVPKLLVENGRVCVISYHSLEDRLVKRFIRSGLFVGEPEKDFYGNVKVPLKKIGKLIVPSKEEIKLNNRARSAKLRIATLSV